MHDIPRKKWERECDDLQPRLHLFYREQKAQDKLDNLAKPFFLGIISSSSLLSHPSRGETLHNPRPISCRQYLYPGSSLVSTDSLLSPFRFSPLFCSLARILILLCGSLSGIPEVWSDRQHGPRRWRLPNGWTTGTYICSFGPSWERNRYLRNVKYLAT